MPPLAGWHSQEAGDLPAVLGPRLVGIPANRIPHFLKLHKRRTFLLGLLRPARRRRLIGPPHLPWEYAFDRETIRVRM